MIRCVAVAACLLLTALPATARADFDKAVAAFDRGDYETALNEWLPLAEDDDPAAQRNVAHLYRQGLGVSQDFAEAVRWYRRAAYLGLTSAQANLASMYLRGQGVDEDPEEAAYWFERAAVGGHILAQYNLGLMYSRGIGVRQSKPRAMGWLYVASKAGHEQALVALSRMVVQEAEIYGPPPPPPGFVADTAPAEPEPATEPLAEAETATDVAANADPAATETPPEAAPADDDSSIFAWFGALFSDEAQAVETDDGGEAAVATPAAPPPARPEADPPTERASLAPPRQPVFAYVLDPPPGLEAAARPVERDRPPPQTPQESLDLEQPPSADTAAAGNDRIMASGLIAYYSGNLRVAHNRWLPIADAGHREAQYQLGLLYDRPDFSDRDRSRSFKWLRLAADQGHPQARDQLRRLENDLTPLERLDGQRMVQDWRDGR